MNTESNPSLVMLNPPERGLEDYKSLLVDFNDLGSPISLNELMEMGLYAIRTVGTDEARLVEMATRIYSSSNDYLNNRIDPSLFNELILLSTETFYYDYIRDVIGLGLLNKPLRLVSIDTNGLLLEY